MKKPYFTRKNLIALSLVIFYAIIVFVTGISIEAGHTLVSKRNVINQLAIMLKFQQIDASLAGFVGLVLMSIYIILFSCMKIALSDSLLKSSSDIFLNFLHQQILSIVFER